MSVFDSSSASAVRLTTVWSPSWRMYNPSLGGQGDTITTALLKECRGLADCVREFHRLMQAMRGKKVKARTKVSPHRRYKRCNGSTVIHAHLLGVGRTATKTTTMTV